MDRVYHVLGVYVDTKEMLGRLDDEKILFLAGNNRDRYIELWRTKFGDVDTEMSEAFRIRRAVERGGLHVAFFREAFGRILRMHNWIRCYAGVPAGGSEHGAESSEEILVLGVQAHEILVSLGFDRKRFANWLADHLETLGFGKVSEEDIKYFCLIG